MLVNEESAGLIHSIDGQQFREMIYSALKTLKQEQSLIDSLNVFPVPDGDTGTNMYLTLQEAVKEVRNLESNRIDDINSALAKGALMGARGNSGVILSQLLRGFSEANKNNEKMKAGQLVNSLHRASEVAYQGVLKPVEGTILTVSRKAADGAEMALEKNLDIVGILENTIEAARQALEKTPEQLPALKEAGVVDAGGQGYLIILEGLLSGLVEKKDTEEFSGMEVIRRETRAESEKESEYGYCTEVLLNRKSHHKSIDAIRGDLQNYGDSLMVVGSDNIIKIHIHTDHPGIVLEYALKIGSLSDIKIDNMQKQHEEKWVRKEETKSEVAKEESVQKSQEQKLEKNKGLIAVGKGEGIKQIFQELGVDTVIDGGQSMNPSTNDFVEAIEALETEEILILPNNKNIISAAQQAANLSDKNILVLETRTIPEAIASLIVYNDEARMEDLKEAMEEEINNVKTIEITRAVKDSSVNGLKIKEGEIIGIFEGDIKVKGDNYRQVVIKLLGKVLSDEELVTIYYGQEVEEEEVKRLSEDLENEFGFEEIEAYYGGQPLYPYIIPLE